MSLLRRRLALALFVLIVLVPSRATLAGAEASHYAIPAADQAVRVGLVRAFRGVKQVIVLASSNCTITRTGTSDKLASSTNLEPITLTAEAGKLSLKLVNGSTIDAGTAATVTPGEPWGTLSVDSPGKPGRQYRGTLEVTLRQGCLQVVNVVDIESYLPGVVTGEMPSSYPDEALKAQAIAARTYTLRALGRHTSLGCDLCDDSHCQVYDGALREKPSVTRAVLATKGQVLTYGGRVASIMYCADCGGATECYAEVHGDTVPYMPTVTEPDGIVHQTWERSYKLAELSARLAAAGIKGCEGLQTITIAKASSSGRVLVFEIRAPKGSARVDGIKLRAALGRDGIRSTLCTVEASADGVVTFRGKGWGHGIGMCQVGAGALACPPFGYTCAKILAHYYPGTVLAVISGTLGVGAARNSESKAPQTSPEPASESLAMRQKRPTQPQPCPAGKGTAPPKPSEAARGILVRVDAPEL